MRKTIDLFKKIRDTKGTFHAKMGTIKDRNDMDLTETEEIKKRWRDFPDGPVVKTLPSNIESMGSIPGQGAKISHSSQPKKKTKHETEAML